MNRVHVTKDGDRMFISEMDDNHLQNMIKLALKGIEEIKAGLRNEVVEDKFKTALYGEGEGFDEDELTDMLERLTTNIYPYLAEIALRGINMSAELQKVFEREGRNQVNSNEKTDFQLLLDQL